MKIVYRFNKFVMKVEICFNYFSIKTFLPDLELEIIYGFDEQKASISRQKQ